MVHTSSPSFHSSAGASHASWWAICSARLGYLAMEFDPLVGADAVAAIDQTEVRHGSGSLAADCVGLAFRAPICVRSARQNAEALDSRGRAWNEMPFGDAHRSSADPRTATI
jgi:hypothetical protein